MGYSERDGRVTLEMSMEDYGLWCAGMGAVVAKAYRNSEPDLARQIIRALNRINEGNPAYRPYEVSE